MWLREYTRLHDLPVSSQESNKSGDLAILFNRALATFFDPTSHLALNLPHNLTSPLLSTTLSTHPNPSIFNDIEAQVKIMLRDSLARFSHRAFGNADRNRSWFSTGLGIACILIGFVPVIVLAVLGKNRWIRLVAFIWFWLGTSAVIAASRGLCLILYSFADARQLYPYELAAPRLPASLAPTSQAPPPSSTFDTLSYDEEQKIGFDALTPLHTASFIPLTLPTDPTSPSPSGSVFKFDFDSLPPATPKSPHYHHSWTDKSAGTSSRSATPSFISSSMTSSPMFGSITRISNPIVRWNQWHIATRSLTFGFVLGAILTAACVAIPPAHLP
ncbi:hypothetical protein FRB99_005209 [Tulasnella sp. 403]|nr:hypothetical protein FRB99_005209 [Tulasnella sp. 403]